MSPPFPRSQEFVRWILEAMFGSQISVPMTEVKDSLPTFTAVKQEGQPSTECRQLEGQPVVEEKEEDYRWIEG